MFKRSYRLTREEFPTLLTKGRRTSSNHFTAVVSKEVSGYAVVVPKKVAKLSVDRHKVKRRIFAALKKMELPPSLVIFSRSSLDGVHYKDIEKELTDLISHIKN